MNSNNPVLSCKYCDKKFLDKNKFEMHSCESKKRFELCRTRKGIIAFDDYRFWLTLKNSKVHDVRTFIDSRYFSSFMNFYDYCQEKGMPDKKMFIRYVHDLRISPFMWKNNEVYNNFLIHFDETVDPIKKVNLSIRTLSILADVFECELGDVYEFLLPSEIARLVYERRLSPWLLLNSLRFKHYWNTGVTASQHVMLSTVLDTKEWNYKFNKNKKILKDIQKTINELNL